MEDGGKRVPETVVTGDLGVDRGEQLPERLVDAPYRLHVLLRHRPPSISGRQVPALVQTCSDQVAVVLADDRSEWVALESVALEGAINEELIREERRAFLTERAAMA
jgi:hypothetical protein